MKGIGIGTYKINMEQRNGKMDRYIQDNIYMGKKMVQGYIYGQMEQNMKVNLKIIHLMDMVFIILKKEKYIWVNGKIIRKTDMENLLLMTKYLQDFIKMIKKMDLVFFIGKIIIKYLWDFGKMGKKMDLGN